jgi:hypothetical protein
MSGKQEEGGVAHAVGSIGAGVPNVLIADLGKAF